MEYLEGETLQARLAKGPLPVEEALRYGVQIAEALAQAHRQGISHRDLKPSNIILTKKGAKLLDFGLAKFREPAPNADGATLTAAPTELTQKGTILGTFQYMSPEQLEGREADSRSDIFAFRAVLYEMAAGRKAFEGKSQASLITAIISSEPPPVSSLQTMSPPALDRVVKKCLAKDPEERWQTAQDLASELKWIAEGAGLTTTAAFTQTDLALQPRRPASRPWSWMIAGVSTLAALLLAITHFREAPPKASAIRFTISAPEKTTFSQGDYGALSPDGERLAFTSSGEGTRQLYIRRLDSLATELLLRTQGAQYPFWSADSRSIAFFADGKLKKIDAQGGPPMTLCDAPFGRPGAWNRDGVILFRPDAGPLYRVSAAGGQAKPATALDTSRQETSHSWAQFLPDGQHFIYLALSNQPENTGIFTASLDSTHKKRLVASSFNGAYAGRAFGMPGPGYLLFLRGDTLMAQPLDAKKIELSGEPFPIAEQVLTAAQGTLAGAACFSVSANGSLAYGSGGGRRSEMVWLDRNGKRLGTVGEPADYSNPALSLPTRSNWPSAARIRKRERGTSGSSI